MATRVCSFDELDEAVPHRVEIGGRTLSVVRLGEDVYVIGDQCSHADVSLSDGDVDADECTIECPKHGSEFDLKTGEPLTLPALRPVPTYSVTVAGDDVLVDLS